MRRACAFLAIVFVLPFLAWKCEGATPTNEDLARSHYFLGEKAFKGGDILTAVVEWDIALALKPSSEHTAKCLTKAKSMMTPRCKAAFQCLERVAAFCKQGKLDEADAALAEAFKYEPAANCLRTVAAGLTAMRVARAGQAGSPARPLPAEGTIRGTVTFYFNRNQGNKADVGAGVWLVKGEVRIPADYVFYGVDSQVYCLKPGYRDALEGNIIDINQIQALSIGGLPAVKHTVGWPCICAGCVKEKRALPALKHTLVDGAGNYVMRNIAPGQYTVILQSANTSGDLQLGATVRDALHRVLCLSVYVKAGEVTDASWDLGMTYM